MSSNVGLGRRVTAAILFIVPWVFYLVLPVYNRVNPEVGGVPFFYWFQTLWLIIAAVLSLIGVYLIYGGES
ncbi:DUF3311 domain-containing protein [Caldivirga maquilingensis]|uniref:Conserved hypothetical membrane protein n=1 Tax=Caldivirga maquilingensis (strain ATCC 700844 / DSM 13496 / JCM 10307 / IC-167) TaxID=397948 RepID=A8MDP9_CALMQ|nr:DUF3311 domain-containing protein [Caldivirga maquilingensis]ABW01905.1 conserved hypothetical membrane protein [Caldivirga maquilingensis IC-167]